MSATVSTPAVASRRLEARRAPVDGRTACGLLLTASVLLLVLVGPWVAPNSPLDFIGSPFDPPSSEAWLGTDVVGRDALSRVLCGGGAILALSAVATLLGVAAGGLLGVCAGYVGGWLDDVVMRGLDVLLAFPQMILALLFVSVLGSNFGLVAALVAALHAPQTARVIRAATLRVRGEDFVLFARAIGTPQPLIVLQEIVPNVGGPLLVEASLRFTFSIALIAGLSFLGLAQQPPAANWGLMVNENRIGLMQNPWPVVAPIVLIAMLTVGVNLLTDAYSRRLARGGGSPAYAGAAQADGANDVGEPL
jgi:peptide/nickel transport system permease protein